MEEKGEKCVQVHTVDCVCDQLVCRALWNIMKNKSPDRQPSRDRLVVRTPRCGRGNPGSNPGHGIDFLHFFPSFFSFFSM